MEGTHQSTLHHTVAWLNNPQEGSIYWFDGLLGTGKTLLAHSIYKRLHNSKHLAGAFLCCWRDDTGLSELRNIVPTLIDPFARIFPLLQCAVANRLLNDPNLKSNSLKNALFLATQTSLAS